MRDRSDLSVKASGIVGGDPVLAGLVDDVPSRNILVQLSLDLVEFEWGEPRIGCSDEGMCFEPLRIIGVPLAVAAICAGLLL